MLLLFEALKVLQFSACVRSFDDDDDDERCSNQSPLQQPLHHYPHNQSQNHTGWETKLQAFLIPFYRQGKRVTRTCPGPQSPSAAKPRPEDGSPNAMCFSHLNSVSYLLLLGSAGPEGGKCKFSRGIAILPTIINCFASRHYYYYCY